MNYEINNVFIYKKGEDDDDEIWSPDESTSVEY